MAVSLIQYSKLIADCLDELEAVMGTRGAGIATKAAQQLLLVTMAAESDFGHYIYQVNGPALGRFQIEPQTFDDIRKRWTRFVPELEMRFARELPYDDRLGIWVARLKYRDAKAQLPIANDWYRMITYWKIYYNTTSGAGRTDIAAMKVREYLGDLVGPHELGH